MLFATKMPGRSFDGDVPPLAEAERDLLRRLEGHVTALADGIGERNVWRRGSLAEAADFIQTTLEGYGYDVGRRPYAATRDEVRRIIGRFGITAGPLGRAVDALSDEITFVNLEAVHPGSSRADEIVVVAAHYDTVPLSPGANDNGSGVAAVLELARLLKGRALRRTVRFVLFANEEPPFFETELMGSRVYARAVRASGDDVRAMFSIETIGYYSLEPGSQSYPFPLGLFYPDAGNFIGFVGNVGSRRLVRESIAAFRRHARFPSEGLVAPALVPGVDWSDHASFWREGYPAVMITDTAPYRYPHYHSASDRPARIDYPSFARVVAGLEKMLIEISDGGPDR